MPREDKMSLIMQELVRRSNEESRRLRVLEQRLQTLEQRSVTGEESSSAKLKKINDKLIELETAMKMQSDETLKIKTNLDRIIKQSDNFARKSDVKEIEKMFELLNPVTHEFVTRKELENMVKRVRVLR